MLANSIFPKAQSPAALNHETFWFESKIYQYFETWIILEILRAQKIQLWFLIISPFHCWRSRRAFLGSWRLYLRFNLYSCLGLETQKLVFLLNYISLPNEALVAATARTRRAAAVLIIFLAWKLITLILWPKRSPIYNKDDRYAKTVSCVILSAYLWLVLPQL